MEGQESRPGRGGPGSRHGHLHATATSAPRNPPSPTALHGGLRCPGLGWVGRAGGVCMGQGRPARRGKSAMSHGAQSRRRGMIGRAVVGSRWVAVGCAAAGCAAVGCGRLRLPPPYQPNPLLMGPEAGWGRWGPGGADCGGRMRWGWRAGCGCWGGGPQCRAAGPCRSKKNRQAPSD
jgi:hypothetical protein